MATKQPASVHDSPLLGKKHYNSFQQWLSSLAEAPYLTEAERAVKLQRWVGALTAQLFQHIRNAPLSPTRRIAWLERHELIRQPAAQPLRRAVALGNRVRHEGAQPEATELAGLFTELAHVLGLLAGAGESTPSRDAGHPEPNFAPQPLSREGQLASLSGYVASLDEAEEGVIQLTETESGERLRVRVGVEGLNELYLKDLHWLWPDANLRLIDSQWEGNELLPRHLILEPDYLMDVTAVAGRYQPSGGDPRLHLVSWLIPQLDSYVSLRGRAVNLLLDELVRADDVAAYDIDALLKERFFAHFPLELTHQLADTSTLKAFIKDIHEHGHNLKLSLAEELPGKGIQRQACYLEPSYLSARYGLQGRLDLLHYSNAHQRLNIIELKSGKPGNNHQAAPWHAAQSHLYRRLLSDARPPETDVAVHVLYSSTDKHALRAVPPSEATDAQLFSLRNGLVAMEYRLAAAETLEEVDTLLDNALDAGKAAPPFLQPSIQSLQSLRQLPSLERLYYASFATFLAREKQAAKVGIGGLHNRGQSRLWLEGASEKQADMALLDGLRLEEDGSNTDNPFIRLAFIEPEKQRTVNFREGDTVVLYPMDDGHCRPLQNQLVKGRIARFSPQDVTLSLYHRQVQGDFFQRQTAWALEADSLDNALDNVLKQLSGFMAAEQSDRKAGLLGLKPPPPAEQEQAPIPFADDRLSEHHHQILRAAIRAPAFYLLQGPPGTGKTSLILRNLLAYYHAHTEGRILLLAFTNRAVDEICEQIDALGLEAIRIGSRLGTAPHHRSKLLNGRAAGAGSRKAVEEMLQQTRVYVGTVASCHTRPELFRMVSFQTAIMDEASQVLEPYALPLLAHVEKHILIGDQCQLPAVVTQPAADTEPWEDRLSDIELRDLRESYFERFWRLAEREGWQHHLGLLVEQGRMHPNIGGFVGEAFYGGELRSAGLPHQTREASPLPLAKTGFEPVRHQRMVFLDLPPSAADLHQKHNEAEAWMLARLARAVAEEHGSAFDPDWHLGIIAPFRNQVALLRRALNQAADTHEQSRLKDVIVDTVERFQGSQRENILLSFCANGPMQAAFLAEASSRDGVDRKLNVALSRARERVWMAGHAEVLEELPAYSGLLAHVRQTGGFVDASVALACWQELAQAAETGAPAPDQPF